MLCTSPPPASPAGSEISVGAPSPPPPLNTRPSETVRKANGGEDYFRPLKRLRMAPSSRETSPSPPPPAHHQPPPQQQQPQSPPSQAAAPSHRSSIDGIKSFSIVDILGRESPTPPPPSSKLNLASPNHFSLHPYLHHPALQHSFDLQQHHNLHQSHPSSKIVRPWDHLRGPVPVRPFLPPALLHYEHRLALDYQRQIHEHLNAQAQLLRHMSMDIIPSESGSDRSSSAASDCCSPEILNRSSSDGHHRSEGNSGSASAAGSKSTKANGTPLDALFQMTSKTFDEQQNESSSGKCRSKQPANFSVKWDDYDEGNLSNRDDGPTTRVELKRRRWQKILLNLCKSLGGEKEMKGRLSG